MKYALKGKWSEDAERRLALAWNDGLTAGECAERFGRRVSCIKAKIKQLRERGFQLREGCGKR